MRRQRRLRAIRRLGAVATVLAVAGASGCTSSPESEGPTTESAPTTRPPATSSPSTDSATTIPGSTVPVPHEVVDGFDDHTVSSIASVDEFHALGRTGVGGQVAVKFSIPRMTVASDVRWLDGNFYELHDEWYWFRLLNGRAVPGFTTAPVQGPRFATVDEIVRWARVTRPLPLDLRFVDSTVQGERLYSPAFYREGIPDGRRNYGLGSVVLLPDAADGADHWLIELEFGDVPTTADVERYFELLGATLPAEIGDRLEWVIRSPEQDAIARALADAGHPLAERVVRFGDLVPPGEIAVYQPGIAVGRLLVVDGETARLTDTDEHDIVVVERPPSWLPPAAALITSDPQTPLAHVNLLARNRGIPNVSIQGILDDPGFRQAARIRSHAVVHARPDGSLDISLITREQYDEWLDRTTPDPIAVVPVDPFSMPLTVDLTELAATIDTDDDVEQWRPIIGGKAAGFLHLLGADGVETPPAPIAITVAPYLRHLATVRAELDAMMADREFQTSARVRFLYLEGLDDFLDAYPDPADAALAERLLAEHPPTTLLGRIRHADGFQRLMRDQPIRADDLDAITEVLRTNFADLDPDQGLRFRSSSSVEDIEGFNGAGLYDSNTGFFDPVAAGEDDDRTIERAITTTWASYWAFEAFEERRLERVSHISGEMGLLVHPRFDDELEVDNGVATYTLLPGDDDAAIATINVQAGDVAVANPEPGVLPEAIEVRVSDGDLEIVRLASSTISDDDVLSDAAIAELVAQLDSVTRLWRDRVNATLPPAQRITTLTLDVEFKTMAEGWPALRSGTMPSRLVLKQARTLEPGLRGFSEELLALPVPRDVLARAGLVVDRCGTIEITTDPLLQPDLGFSRSPLVVATDPAPACVERTLHASPERLLTDLLADGDPLTIVGSAPRPDAG